MRYNMKHTLWFNLQSYISLYRSLLLNELVLFLLSFDLDSIQNIVKLLNLIMHLLLKFLLAHRLLLCLNKHLRLTKSLLKDFLSSLRILLELRLSHKPGSFLPSLGCLLLKAHLVHLLAKLQIVLPASLFALPICLQKCLKLLLFIKLSQVDQLLIFNQLLQPGLQVNLRLGL